MTRRDLGFIAQATGQDVFVHHTSILGTGFKTLREGETVSFEVMASEKGPQSLECSTNSLESVHSTHQTYPRSPKAPNAPGTFFFESGGREWWGGLFGTQP